MTKLVFGLILGVWLLVHRGDAALGGLDLSNLDLKKFRFFRNLPSQDPAMAPYVNPILELFQKKKAILEYLDRLVFGNSLFGPPVKIEFNPQYGQAWQPHFEKNYGRRAERLIELLGSGASEEELKYYGAIPKDFGSYH